MMEIISWWLILALAGVTFFNRYLFLSKSFAYQPSAKLKRFLSYSSYSVLTAIWVPFIVNFDSPLTLRLAGWDYAIAATLAAVLTVSRVSSILVVLISTGAFFVVRFLV